MTPLLRRFDVRVSRWSRSYEYQRMRYMHDAGVVAVVDVGANIGQYGAELRADGYGGRLLSIEPLGSAFRDLAGRTARDPLWTCVQCGLGDRDGDAVLSVSANGFSSSILPILDSHVEAAPESRVQGAEKIRVRTLDSVVGEWSDQPGALGLKLDVQGYEAQVLRGAGDTLPRVALLEIELSLVPLYARQTLFIDMIEHVRALGFSLVNMETGFSDPRTGRVLQFDGIFLKSQ
jgi:FkbM family methyltransferase